MMKNFDGRVFPWNADGLTGLEISPESDKAGRLVVLLHGYGGDALSNMTFACSIAESAPDAAVCVIDGTAPVPNENNPQKRQWWNLDDAAFDGAWCSFMPDLAPKNARDTMRRAAVEANETAGKINRFVINRLDRDGLTPRDCVLIGISQGGMTAFECVLFRPELTRADDALGGLASIGSGILRPDRLRERTTPFPPVPVLLARGEFDEIFPKTVDLFSRSLLTELGTTAGIVERPSGHYGLERAVCGDVCAFIGDPRSFLQKKSNLT